MPSARQQRVTVSTTIGPAIRSWRIWMRLDCVVAGDGDHVLWRSLFRWAELVW